MQATSYAITCECPRQLQKSPQGLEEDEGIDGKRKSDAIIMPEVIVELPQILSLQA